LGELDGVLFSNGAGDPRCLIERPHLLAVYRKIAETLPTMGICFGHQALALAFGARIDKLTFGHHAVNHPVARVDKDGSVKSVAITSQNHNYAVSRGGLPATLVVSHLHLNDGTIAGLRHRDGLFQSVQFHPEAGPGPHDAGELFDEFVESLKGLGIGSC
jgi:carbamoyl-phosphate synthase small subunit